jgi:hypothetical protein
MVPSEGAPQELSNEWSCQYFHVSFPKILNYWYFVHIPVSVNSFKGLIKIQKVHFSPDKLMIPSESAPQKLSK